MYKVFALLMVLGLTFTAAHAQTSCTGPKTACAPSAENCPPACFADTEEAKACLEACKAKGCAAKPSACQNMDADLAANTQRTTAQTVAVSNQGSCCATAKATEALAKDTGKTATGD